MPHASGPGHGSDGVFALRRHAQADARHAARPGRAGVRSAGRRLPLLHVSVHDGPLHGSRAAENNLEFIVLDRPNPLGGQRVEGPGIEKQWISFVGQFPVPYVHGLTAGELAKMINANHWVAAQCRLTVIPMRGWQRGMTWGDTGLHWIKSSPNIPRGDSPLYYVATGHRGKPERAGPGHRHDARRSSWWRRRYLNADSFTAYLRSLDTPGVRVHSLPRGRTAAACVPGDRPARAGQSDGPGHLHYDRRLYRVGRHAALRARGDRSRPVAL